MKKGEKQQSEEVEEKEKKTNSWGL